MADALRCGLPPQERKNLAFTLKDTKSVVAHVEMMLGFFLHTLFAFAYLYIFEVKIYLYSV